MAKLREYAPNMTKDKVLGSFPYTPKDIEDIRTAAKLQSDYLAVSFVRDRDDVDEAWDILRSAGGEGRIVAKIERRDSATSAQSWPA